MAACLYWLQLQKAGPVSLRIANDPGEDGKCRSEVPLEEAGIAGTTLFE